MGRLIATCILVMGFASTGAQAAVQKEVSISISDVFIPEDAKPNGDSFVVVSGMFPNSCYRWNRGQVNNETENMHEVKIIATVTETMCLMVLVPFSKEVNLGRMSRGEHTLRFLNGDGTYFERVMTVQ